MFIIYLVSFQSYLKTFALESKTRKSEMYLSSWTSLSTLSTPIPCDASLCRIIFSTLVLSSLRKMSLCLCHNVSLQNLIQIVHHLFCKFYICYHNHLQAFQFSIFSNTRFDWHRYDFVYSFKFFSSNWNYSVWYLWVASSRFWYQLCRTHFYLHT